MSAVIPDRFPMYIVQNVKVHEISHVGVTNHVTFIFLEFYKK
jgi:hypothetical protein